MDNSTPGMSEMLVQYMDGELQGTAKETLEQKLAADVALQQEFDSLLLSRESIRYYGIKEKVAGIHVQMMEELKVPVRTLMPSKKFFRYVASVAASILLIVGGYMAFTFFNLSSEKVYSANYQKYELSTTRSNGTEETVIEKEYRTGNYKEVIRINEAREDNAVKAKFLSGMAAMELSDNSKAIKSFNAVLAANKKAGTKTLNDETEYYLSLSYVRNKDYDAALDLMNKIKEDAGHIYHKEITTKLIRQVKLLKWR